MKYWFLNFLTLCLCLQPFLSIAQDDLDKVDIYTKYKPVLTDARRIESQPELKEPETKAPKLDYTFPDLRYKVQPAFTPVAAMPYRVTPNKFVKTNFIKAGFGNYSTPLVHLELHNGKDNNYAFGVNAYHLSSSGQPKYKSFMDDNISVYGTKFMNGNTLKGQLGYSRFGYNYYGYEHDSAETSFKRDSVKQAMNNISGNLHFDNHQTKKQVQIAYDFDMYRFSTVQQNELGYRIANRSSGKIAKGVLEFNTAFEGMASGPDSVKYSRHYIDINPVYKMRYKEFDLSIGAMASVFLDSGIAENKFYLYPDFRVDYYVVPEKMKAFAGIGGGIVKGSTRVLYNENPFLAENQPLKNMNTSYSIFGGIKGKLGSSFDYTLEFSQQFVFDIPLYVSDTFALRKFLVLYDNVDLFKFKIGLNYSRFDKLNISTNFSFFSYKGNETHAYQRPDFEWNTTLSATVSDKLALHGKFYIIGTRYARHPETWESVKLAPIADLNIGADYRYKKNISFFIDLNNLTNQTYQRWINYPAYGFNAVGGITFTL